MRIESKLCHISENKAIVLVNGWVNDKRIGSALAEGSTVELAEDKAISRLYKRVNNIENSINLKYEDTFQKERIVELPNHEKIEDFEENKEPIDWSNDLTAIDAEIKRLNWSREDEIKFIEKTLGYNNRNKITKYNELVKYLSILKKINSTNNSNNNIEKMLIESEIILRDLSWNHHQGREYLRREFNVSTRKELNEKQLTSFVEKLKSIRNKNLPS